MMRKLAKQSKENVILLVGLQVGLSGDGGGGGGDGGGGI